MHILWHLEDGLDSSLVPRVFVLEFQVKLPLESLPYSGPPLPAPPFSCHNRRLPVPSVKEEILF